MGCRYIYFLEQIIQIFLVEISFALYITAISMFYPFSGPVKHWEAKLEDVLLGRKRGKTCKIGSDLWYIINLPKGPVYLPHRW